jgi:hypothetical protein
MKLKLKPTILKVHPSIVDLQQIQKCSVKLFPNFFPFLNRYKWRRKLNTTSRLCVPFLDHSYLPKACFMVLLLGLYVLVNTLLFCIFSVKLPIPPNLDDKLEFWTLELNTVVTDVTDNIIQSFVIRKANIQL